MFLDVAPGQKQIITMPIRNRAGIIVGNKVGGKVLSALSPTVGQIITSSVAQGSAVVLTSNTVAVVTSIALPPGFWHIWGTIGFSGGAVLATRAQGFFGTASGTSTSGQDLAYNTVSTTASPTAAGDTLMPMPLWEQDFTYAQGVAVGGAATGKITYYLKALAMFTSGATAYGSITAQRMR